MGQWSGGDRGTGLAPDHLPHTHSEIPEGSHQRPLDLSAQGPNFPHLDVGCGSPAVVLRGRVWTRRAAVRLGEGPGHRPTSPPRRVDVQVPACKWG